MGGSHGSVALVSAKVVDAAGLVVPHAADNVTFSVDGAEIVGTANGDPACHVRSTSPTCPAFHGLVMAVIRAGLRSGRLVVTASAPGLRGAQLPLHVSAAASTPSLPE